MPKYALWSLYLSIAILFPVFVSLGSLQPLYYVLWVLGVGSYVYRHRDKIETCLLRWRVGAFKKFMGIGISLIFLEEVFATLAMHGMRYLTDGSLITFGRDVLQFWALNLLALPGMFIAWFILLTHYSYSKKEVFVLAGLFGIFSEKVYAHVVAFPLVGWLLIVPTIFTYGLLVSVPALSVEKKGTKKPVSVVRYALALVLPVLCSVPFIAILSYLYAHNPDLFPPFGYFAD